MRTECGWQKAVSFWRQPEWPSSWPGAARGTPDLTVSHVDSGEALSAARATLYRQAQSSDGEARTRALETLGLMVGRDAGSIYLENLDHPANAVRFAAAMACGDCRYAPAEKKLQELLGKESTDQSLQCAAIYALHRLGDDTYTSRLAEILYEGQPEGRANAALVMGKMGLPAAIPRLNERLKADGDTRVKLQIAESLTALNHAWGFKYLMGVSITGQPHEQLQAIEALGRSRSEQTRSTLVNAFDAGDNPPPPIRIAAAEGLARIGDNRGLKVMLMAVQDPPALARESFGKRVPLNDAQAAQYKTLGALALGEVHQPGIVDILRPMLNDKNPTVTIAAAKSILNLLAPPVYAPPGKQQTVSAPPPMRQTVQPAGARSPAAQPAPAGPMVQPAPSPAQPAPYRPAAPQAAAPKASNSDPFPAQEPADGPPLMRVAPPRE